MASEANLKRRTHDDYTVGWVCSLPKEKTAAMVMLDHRHADLPTPAGDPNTYVLGSIFTHNIVIASFQNDTAGKHSAATVVSWMVRAFPSIRFGLMTGIGGGIPPTIRFGDIVIGSPFGSSPVDIQLDFGNIEENAAVKLTNSLHDTLADFLMALRELKHKNELYGSMIPQYLDQLKNEWKRSDTKRLRPPHLKKLLLAEEYSHVSEDTTYDEIFELNDRDDGGSREYDKGLQALAKMLRHVHLKGDTISHDRIFEDIAIQNKHAKHVLCIDMEVTGPLHDFPCIVIKAIYEYSDTYEDEIWQECAVFFAAAYARELLKNMQMPGNYMFEEG
ncbi:purine and uridine phosphorylase [Trichoderma chlorosporum]